MKSSQKEFLTKYFQAEIEGKISRSRSLKLQTLALENMINETVGQNLLAQLKQVDPDSVALEEEIIELREHLVNRKLGMIQKNLIKQREDENEELRTENEKLQKEVATLKAQKQFATMSITSTSTNNTNVNNDSKSSPFSSSAAMFPSTTASTKSNVPQHLRACSPNFLNPLASFVMPGLDLANLLGLPGSNNTWVFEFRFLERIDKKELIKGLRNAKLAFHEKGFSTVEVNESHYTLSIDKGQLDNFMDVITQLGSVAPQFN